MMNQVGDFGLAEKFYPNASQSVERDRWHYSLRRSGTRDYFAPVRPTLQFGDEYTQTKTHLGTIHGEMGPRRLARRPCCRTLWQCDEYLGSWLHYVRVSMLCSVFMRISFIFDTLRFCSSPRIQNANCPF